MVEQYSVGWDMGGAEGEQMNDGESIIPLYFPEN